MTFWQNIVPKTTAGKTLLALFLLASYFPIFLHLDTYPIKTWDESLFAMRAYHFAETGQYLQNFDQFPGLIHHPNSKPLFTTILQAISFKIFGYNELGLRLPVALMAFTTILLLLLFSKKQLGNYLPGIFAGLVLLTSHGYIRVHVMRTGDHDGPLSFYLFVMLLSFYYWLTSEDARRRRLALLVFGLSVLAAFLTKSIAGLLFFPGFLLYAIYKKRLGHLLRRGWLYAVLGGLIALTSAYFFWANQQFDRSLELTFNDAFVRYFQGVGLHAHPFSYYWERLWTESFYPWAWFLPLGILAGWHSRSQNLKDITVLSTACVFTTLLLLSFSKAKLPWYDAMIYPPASLIVGIGLYVLWQEIERLSPKIDRIPRSAWVVYFALLVFAYPYSSILDYVYKQKLDDKNEKFAYLMEKLHQQRPDIRAYTITALPRNGQVAFYSTVYNEKKGYDIEVEADVSTFQAGELILACQLGKLNPIAERFEFEMVEAYEECQLIRLLAEKN